MSKWPVKLVQVLILGSAVGLAGCGGKDTTTRSESNNGYGPNSPGGGAAPVPGPSTTPGGSGPTTGGQHNPTGGGTAHPTGGSGPKATKRR